MAQIQEAEEEGNQFRSPGFDRRAASVPKRSPVQPQSSTTPYRNRGFGSPRVPPEYEDPEENWDQPSGRTSILPASVLGMQQLTLFDGKESPRDNREWFDQFEFLANSCGWTSKQKLSTLRHYCRGAAREWWTFQSRQVTLHWSTLRPLFIHTFCTDRRSKTQLYITAQQKSDETPSEFYRRLTNLARRAEVKLANTGAWEEHVDLFLNGLRSHSMRNQLRVIQFQDSADVQATLERVERTASSYRPERREERDLSSPTRPTGPVARFKMKSNSGFTPDSEKQPRNRKAHAYLTQLDELPESEGEEEDEFITYIIEDENGEEQVYMARTKDIRPVEKRTQREERVREKCSACGKTGHGPDKCWLKTTCSECGSVGHPAEVCYRRCKFCDKIHESKGPCPLKAPLTELIKWARTTADQTGKPLPALPDQLLNW